MAQRGMGKELHSQKLAATSAQPGVPCSREDVMLVSPVLSRGPEETEFTADVFWMWDSLGRTQHSEEIQLGGYATSRGGNTRNSSNTPRLEKQVGTTVSRAWGNCTAGQQLRRETIPGKAQRSPKLFLLLLLVSCKGLPA